MQGFQAFQPNVGLSIEATSQNERDAFGGKSLIVNSAQEFAKLQSILNANKFRRNFRNSILYFESGRSIVNVKPLAFAFEFIDPFDEEVAWNSNFAGLSNRWQDTQHAIFKKIQIQKSNIANRAIQLRKDGKTEMNLSFDDPLDIFRDAFDKLLGPKRLVKADMQGQKLIYSEDGEERSIDTLSSGEREVVNIAFHFLLRKPSDCIIFFDEPEVHLHPELLIRLVSTLRSIGENNQFIFLSHSPDLVSGSLEDSVVFLRPKTAGIENQAFIVKPGDETTKAMHQLGHSVGILSLGRKIAVIEGTNASLDKRTYSQILRNRFPDIVLVPGGGKEAIRNFGTTVSGVLDKAVWGVEFFLLMDRDSQGQIELDEDPRLAMLPRYHLENYFLDNLLLADCFESIEETGHWLRNADEIEAKLRAIASEKISYVTALATSHHFRIKFGNLDIMPKNAHTATKDQLLTSLTEAATAQLGIKTSVVNEVEVSDFAARRFDYFNSLLKDGTGSWKSSFPGRPIFNTFCSIAGMSSGRVKNLYLKKAESQGNEVFSEIVTIFENFSKI